jgi:hypothetical protein
MIEWLSKYGTVFGFALVHHRFGYTSSWFALSAPFNVGALEGRSSAVLGGLTLLIVSFHLSVICKYIFTKREVKTDWFLAAAYLICLPYTLIETLMSVSPSPDFPVYILTIIITWALLILCSSRAANPSLTDSPARLIPLILSIGAVSVKLTSLPLLAVAIVFCVFRTGMNVKKLIVIASLTMVLISPLILANVKSTGCPLYPSTVLCQDYLPWALNKQKVREQRESIEHYARYVIGLSDKKPWRAWLHYWLIDQYTGTIKSDGLILVLSLLSLAGLVGGYKPDNVKSVLWVTLVWLLGTGFIMVNAPYLRYGLGYFCLLPGLAISLSHKYSSVFIALIPLSVILLIPYTDLTNRRLRLALLAIAAGLYFITLALRHLIRTDWSKYIYLSIALFLPLTSIIGNSSCNLKNYLRDRSRFLIPPKIFSPERFQLSSNKVGNMVYFIPLPSELNNQCWGAPLPCTPELTVAQIRLRDERAGIAKGFIIDTVKTK